MLAVESKDAKPCQDIQVQIPADIMDRMSPNDSLDDLQCHETEEEKQERFYKQIDSEHEGFVPKPLPLPKVEKAPVEWSHQRLLQYGRVTMPFTVALRVTRMVWRGQFLILPDVLSFIATFIHCGISNAAVAQALRYYQALDGYGRLIDAVEDFSQTGKLDVLMKELFLTPKYVLCRFNLQKLLQFFSAAPGNEEVRKISSVAIRALPDTKEYQDMVHRWDGITAFHPLWTLWACLVLGHAAHDDTWDPSKLLTQGDIAEFFDLNMSREHFSDCFYHAIGDLLLKEGPYAFTEGQNFSSVPTQMQASKQIGCLSEEDAKAAKEAFQGLRTQQNAFGKFMHIDVNAVWHYLASRRHLWPLVTRQFVMEQEMQILKFFDYNIYFTGDETEIPLMSSSLGEEFMGTSLVLIQQFWPTLMKNIPDTPLGKSIKTEINEEIVYMQRQPAKDHVCRRGRTPCRLTQFPTDPLIYDALKDEAKKLQSFATTNEQKSEVRNQPEPMQVASPCSTSGSTSSCASSIASSIHGRVSQSVGSSPVNMADS